MEKFVEIHRYRCIACKRVVEIEGEEKPVRCPSLICPNHKNVPNGTVKLPWQLRKAEQESELVKPVVETTEPIKEIVEPIPVKRGRPKKVVIAPAQADTV